MLELGSRSAVLHEQVAGFMLDAGVELIAATGEFVEAFAGAGSRAHDGLILEPELEGAYRQLASRLVGGEIVLLKASRGMKFERAIPWFERDFGDGGQVGSSDTEG
jgi:UDP-N-acetylmuramoyl-tripeptide--D-alanyl-D-alanine ligase